MGGLYHDSKAEGPLPHGSVIYALGHPHSNNVITYIENVYLINDAIQVDHMIMLRSVVYLEILL